MMGAASLPQPQGSTPAGFAAFLGAIGQTPTGSGEELGFEQLLAAVPKVDAAAIKAVPGQPVDPMTPETPLTPTAPVAVAAATTVAPAAAAVEAVAMDIAVTTPVTITEDGAPPADRAPDTAAASAAKLLIALNSSAAKPQTKALNTHETETRPDGEPVTDNNTAAAKPAETVTASEAPAPATGPAPTTTLPIAAAPVAAAVVAAVVGKPVKVNDPTPAPAAGTAPVVETVAAAPTADKPRSAETKPAAPEIETVIAAPTAAKPRPAPLPAAFFTGGATVAAKPADAAPLMTIQFAQPTATGAAMPTVTAAPMTVAERILDLASDGAWIDQLARDIAATKSDNGDISFRLMPRHLGRLDVAMHHGDDGVALKLDTQHEATATIVTAAQSRLIEDLRQQGVRVTGSEVTCTPGDTSRQSQGEGRDPAPDTSHLIETAAEHAEPRKANEAADRRGRFA